MTVETWPSGSFNDESEIGGYLNFMAQPFHLTSDDRSQFTIGGNADPSIHNLTLPYVNSVSNDTSTWDTADNSLIWGKTDADTGWHDWMTDWFHDFWELFGAAGFRNELNMEVSSAGYKGPVLRQRHYSWNLINRSGSGEEGAKIAAICKAFQASIYPHMNPWRTADNIIFPPPMWTTTYFPSDNPIDSVASGQGASDAAAKNSGHPTTSKSGHNKWRWNMDPFTSVLMNVSISPTAATDSIQVMTNSGWPLVTVLKCSFLEIDQVIAGGGWNYILPYSWAQDENNQTFFAGEAAEGNSDL